MLIDYLPDADQCTLCSFYC